VDCGKVGPDHGIGDGLIIFVKLAQWPSPQKLKASSKPKNRQV